jgi:hypothetical protein
VLEGRKTSNDPIGWRVFRVDDPEDEDTRAPECAGILTATKAGLSYYSASEAGSEPSAFGPRLGGHRGAWGGEGGAEGSAAPPEPLALPHLPAAEAG